MPGVGCSGVPGVHVVRGTPLPSPVACSGSWEHCRCAGRVQGASHLPCNPGLLLCHDPEFSWHFSSFEMLGRSGAKVTWAGGVSQKAGQPCTLLQQWLFLGPWGRRDVSTLGCSQVIACRLSPAHTRSSSKSPALQHSESPAQRGAEEGVMCEAMGDVGSKP